MGVFDTRERLAGLCDTVSAQTDCQQRLNIFSKASGELTMHWLGGNNLYGPTQLKINNESELKNDLKGHIKKALGHPTFKPSIRLNARHSDAVLVHTLVHELVHVWQDSYGMMYLPLTNVQLTLESQINLTCFLEAMAVAEAVRISSEIPLARQGAESSLNYKGAVEAYELAEKAPEAVVRWWYASSQYDVTRARVRRSYEVTDNQVSVSLMDAMALLPKSQCPKYLTGDLVHYLNGHVETNLEGFEHGSVLYWRRQLKL